MRGVSGEIPWDCFNDLTVIEVDTPEEDIDMCKLLDLLANCPRIVSILLINALDPKPDDDQWQSVPQVIELLNLENLEILFWPFSVLLHSAPSILKKQHQSGHVGSHGYNALWTT